MNIYILTAENKITTEMHSLVGVFLDYEQAVGIAQQLQPHIEAVLNINVQTVTIDQLLSPYATKINIQNLKIPPAYILNEFEAYCKEKVPGAAIKQLYEDINNKIISEIEQRLENLDLVKDYIQGLKDHTEDYL